MSNQITAFKYNELSRAVHPPSTPTKKRSCSFDSVGLNSLGEYMHLWQFFSVCCALDLLMKELL